MEDKVSPIKKHKLLTSRSVFPLPLLFSRLSTILFIDREIHETIPLQCRTCFSLFYEKNVSRKTFLDDVCEALALQAASAYKRREFWRETHTPL